MKSAAKKLALFFRLIFEVHGIVSVFMKARSLEGMLRSCERLIRIFVRNDFSKEAAAKFLNIVGKNVCLHSR